MIKQIFTCKYNKNNPFIWHFYSCFCKISIIQKRNAHRIYPYKSLWYFCLILMSCRTAISKTESFIVCKNFRSCMWGGALLAIYKDAITFEFPGQENKTKNSNSFASKEKLCRGKQYRHNLIPRRTSVGWYSTYTIRSQGEAL